jgi:hypothetical protein
MKVKADYATVETRPGIVFIVDLNDGNMSVTNDAEAVVDEVVRNYRRHTPQSISGPRIIYRDSDGQWDELVHVNGVFKTFARYTGAVPPKKEKAAL